MRIIEQLVYKIQGDNTEFDRSIDKSETKVSKFGSVADKMLAGVTVAAVTMVIKKVGDMVVATAQATDRVDKMSQKIGISRKAFQEWDFILSQSGTSVDGLQMAVKTLSGAADEASKGTLQYKESFDRLGVSVTDINGNMKDQETLFNEVFVALSNLDNQTERTAIANDLLGRSATELAPAFNAGGDAIEDMRVKAHELGLVMDDELIDNGVVLTDNIDKLKRAYKGWKNEALEPLLGLAVTFTDKLLGQNTASKNLNTTYETLKTTVDGYNALLDSSKGKTDAITQATIAQAKAQMQLALQNASEAYRDTRNELEKYNSSIETSQKEVARFDRLLAEIAQGTGYTTEQLNIMTKQERLSAIAMAKGVDEGDRYNIMLTAREGYQRELIDSMTKLSVAQSSELTFVDALTEGTLANNEATQLLLDTYPELKQKVSDNLVDYERRKKASEEAQKTLEDEKKALLDLGKEITKQATNVVPDAQLAFDNWVAAMERAGQGSRHVASTVKDDETPAVEESSEAIVENTNVVNDAQVAFDKWIESIRRAGQGSRYVASAVKDETTPAVEESTEAVVENTNVVNDAQKAFDKWKAAQDRAAQGARNTGKVVKEEATPALKSFGDTMEEIGTTGFNSFLSGFEDIGKAIGEGSNVWKAFEAAGLNAIASVVEALGHELAARAVIHALALDWAGFGLATAGAASAYTAAGLLRANIPSYDVGSIRIPETQTATVHKDEMILTAPQAEQARREGITIAPTKNGGNSINLMIYLDGKEIARNTIDNLNSGSVGTIKARVVK